MFFNKPVQPEVQIEAKPVEAAADPYAKLRQLYFTEVDGQRLILSVAQIFKRSNSIMSFSDGSIWQTSYIGQVLEFLNNTIQQIGMNVPPTTMMAKWLDGHLPSNLNPQIEIGPDRILDYAIQTMRKFPTNECEQFLEQLVSFKASYDSCEIVENLRK